MLLFFQYTRMQIMSWTFICFLWKLNTILVQMFEVLLYLRLNKASYWNTQIYPWILWLYRGLEYHLCGLMLYNSELWASCSCKRNVISRAKSSTVLMEMNDFGMNSSAGYRIDFKGNNAIHLNKDRHEAFRVKFKKKRKSNDFLLVHVWLHGRTLHRRYPWSWTSEPEPEVCCRLQRPMKEYRLFVIGSVTTECTRQQMRKWKKNALGGLKCHVNSWVQPLNTSGVLSTPFNAFKGQGFAQTRLCCYSPDRVSDHNFQRHLERKWICESKSKQWNVWKESSAHY